MGISDLIERARERGRERKEMIRKMDEQIRAEETLSNRRKSANERELEQFMKEDREERIKFQLDHARKTREEDIKFNHNPLNVKNIMKSEWEIMKERNMFKNKPSMFANQQFIHKNNPKLLKSNMRLMR